MQINMTKKKSNLGRKLSVFALLLISGIGLAQSRAQAIDGAKNLFYRQIEQPSAPINTGLQYWIELKRAGKVLNVSNKFAFKSGDKIRIHVKSNIDGYAYVLLVEGSRGEQSILFPDPQFHDNNRISSNRDIPIPGEGYLAFDQNPGTEKLVLLLSRTQMDAAKYIADKAKTRVQIAAVPNGSKDLIPGSVVLAYAEQDGNASDLAKPPQKPQNQPAPTDNAETNKVIASSESAVTTLVQKNPQEVLAVDVALMHQP